MKFFFEFLYADLQDGLGLATWDKASLTYDDLKTLLLDFVYTKGSLKLVSVVLWTNPFQLKLVQDMLLEQGFKNVLVFT